ncbi:CHO2 [Candida theae]|uniref:Phosphatidylethanolamine N-methyltransferase n=1 Tax=Candida theae TaxID=1198502 RepID=A0AAD5BHI8_9ASCO|nr:CHO2 [Candida theae]KAI5963896.1 CHO2 [Candida theae]
MSVEIETTSNSPVIAMDSLTSPSKKLEKHDAVSSLSSSSSSSSSAAAGSGSGPKGITFSGETFAVPETHDMVKTLFDPSLHKSNSELAILACLCANLLVFLIPSNQARIVIFVAMYTFWRLSYNFGIGWLLQQQSKHNRLVSWAKEGKLFDTNNTSFRAQLVQNELKSQRGKDYDISSLPIEFNTWLIFRKLVDLILMSDFVTFCCVVYTCSLAEDFSNSWTVYLRVLVGSSLILFNLWVKVNAHNTIKDYAWYWGDFFFRQINNEELIFDGVFEMVPHPMYSVGYIGYYGFALIAKSYTVLAISIFGHFLQMIFLHYIENPHIDKIYGPSKNEINLIKILKLKDLKHFENMPPLVGFYNFNWMRASDVLNLILISTYGIIIPILSKNSYKLFFALTVATKLFESFVINTLLLLQSYSKYFTKWCLSNDIPVEKSLNNWAILYNSLINLTYSSLFGMNLAHVLQGTTEVFFHDFFYLRVLIGCLLIATQTWINASIIDSIGYFGYFYGDFFIAKSHHLTKAGVYRYLNNPEQIFGVCGVMGVFVIWPTFENLVCCILWVANNFVRINFIEKFHMLRVYGEQEVNQDSGVTKTFKKHLIPDVIQRRISNDEPSRRSRRRSSHPASGIAESFENFIKDLQNSSVKLSKQKLIELSQNLSFANSDYKLTLPDLKTDSTTNSKYITIGTPIKVNWQSPAATHSPKDWIGLYKISQTSYSRNKTLLSSSGRWGNCETPNGSLTFAKEKLFWEQGVYEVRYHLDSGHDVAYISEPFEIRTTHIDVPTKESSLDEFAKQLKTEVFDKVLDIDSINTSIQSIATQSDSNVLELYQLLSSIVSQATNIRISSKIYLNHDDTSIKDVANRLYEINQILNDLSYDMSIKKNE